MRDTTEFGANDWLVDEMYQQYLADRTSVDPAWWEFFAGYQAPDRSASSAAAVAPTVTPLATAAAPIKK